MAIERTFTLVVEYEGAYEAQAAAYDPDVAGTAKGAGEGAQELEELIRNAKFSANNTDISVKSLTRQ